MVAPPSPLANLAEAVPLLPCVGSRWRIHLMIRVTQTTRTMAWAIPSESMPNGTGDLKKKVRAAGAVSRRPGVVGWGPDAMGGRLDALHARRACVGWRLASRRAGGMASLPGHAVRAAATSERSGAMEECEKQRLWLCEIQDGTSMEESLLASTFCYSVVRRGQFPIRFQELGMHPFVFGGVLKQTIDRA